MFMPHSAVIKGDLKLMRFFTFGQTKTLSTTLYTTLARPTPLQRPFPRPRKAFLSTVNVELNIAQVSVESSRTAHTQARIGACRRSGVLEGPLARCGE